MVISNKRWKAYLIVVFIFVVGFLAGALAANLIPTASDRPSPAGHEPKNSKAPIDQLTEQLSLTPEQREVVSQILTETRGEYDALRQESRPRYREIRTRSRDRIRAVLNPEQREKFETLVRLRDEENNQRRKHK